MAKGDANKVQNQIDYQGGTAQNNLNNLWGQNTDRTTNFQNLFQGGVNQNLNDYSGIKNAYQSFASTMPNAGNLYSTFLGSKYSGAAPTASGNGIANPDGSGKVDTNADPVTQLFQKYGVKDTGQGSGVSDLNYWKGEYERTGDPYYLGRLEDDFKGNGMDAFNPQTGTSGGTGGRSDSAIGKAIAGYSDFADTGGFSPQDIANIRARSIAPIRSMADQNTQEIQRQNAIRGTAYSPNTAAAIAKVARDANYAAGDTATNAEANIAQLKQQGRLYGLGGLSGTGLSDQSNNTQNRGLDLSAINSSAGNTLGAISGQGSLYGATPGLINTFGNQVLNSGAQGLQLGGLQNQLASLILGGQVNKSQIPGDFQSILGNIGSGLGLAGDLISPIGALTNLFKGNPNPSTSGGIFQ
jgi:hypothetical protein